MGLEGLQVFECEYRIDPVFGLELALADEEVCYLFGAAEYEVAVAVAVVVFAFVGVSLCAFGHIAVYQVKTSDFQWLEFEIIGGFEQLRVVNFVFLLRASAITKQASDCSLFGSVASLTEEKSAIYSGSDPSWPAEAIIFSLGTEESVLPDKKVHQADHHLVLKFLTSDKRSVETSR